MDTIIANVKIVVVDDDELIREFVAEVLSYSVNRQVLAFGNAREAMAHLEEEAADIVVCSMELAGNAGEGLLRRMKESGKPLDCIAMSAYPAHENAAVAMGADAFLAKPFGVSELFELVHRFVVCSEGRRETPLRECPAPEEEPEGEVAAKEGPGGIAGDPSGKGEGASGDGVDAASEDGPKREPGADEAGEGTVASAVALGAGAEIVADDPAEGEAELVASGSGGGPQ